MYLLLSLLLFLSQFCFMRFVAVVVVVVVVLWIEGGCLYILSSFSIPVTDKVL